MCSQCMLLPRLGGLATSGDGLLLQGNPKRGRLRFYFQGAAPCWRRAPHMAALRFMQGEIPNVQAFSQFHNLAGYAIVTISGNVKRVGARRNVFEPEVAVAVGC